jgi:hypothetical protein
MFSLSDLTVSATASSRGLSNEPATDAHRNNLNLMVAFLEKIPHSFRINSVYRSPTVNAAVGGAKSSQHMQGLAIDLSPNTMSNKEFATWLWQYQESFPELDQVIWYTDTSHVHVGICPAGAVGCVSGAPRKAFYTAKKEGSNYTRWIPEDATILPVLQTYAEVHPLRTLGLVFAGVSTVVGVVFLALRRRRKKRNRA